LVLVVSQIFHCDPIFAKENDSEQRFGDLVSQGFTIIPNGNAVYLQKKDEAFFCHFPDLLVAETLKRIDQGQYPPSSLADLVSLQICHRL